MTRWSLVSILLVTAVACGGGDDAEPADTPEDSVGVQAEQMPPAESPPAVQTPSAPVSRMPTVALPAVDEPWTPTHTGTVNPGMTRDQVIETWGPPVTERALGAWTYLYFRNGCEASCGTFDVVVPRVDLEIKPGIGYIRIDRFSESTADELDQKIKKLEGITGLILDLRDNRGGLLNQAIEVADKFVPKGSVIVSTKGRMEGSARPYKALSLEKVRVPMVVLINRHSASSSEIVAGALQDHDRAVIVGETSFGKGLVQSVYTLENATGMALTTAKYYTPSGRLIQRDYTGSSFE